MKNIFNPNASYEEAQKLPKERAVRSIIKTSVHDGCNGINLEDDLVVLEEALKREEKGSQRKSLITKLNAKIKKLRKDQGKLEITVDNNPEVLANDKWQRARDYASAAKRFAKASVACQVMLGFELTALKKELGYVQGGKRKKQKAHDALFASFEEHVKAELGISKDTARRFIDMSEAVKRRLKSCYKNLPLLEKPITEYSDEQLNLLDKAVEKVTDGETQKSLLVEWKIAKAPQGSAAKGGNLNNNDEEEEEEEPTMEQLAFIMFQEPVQHLSKLRTHVDYKKALHALPPAGKDENAISLVTLERDLEAMLADVKEAKKILMNQDA